jgi:N-acetylglucosamine kinase
MLICFDIGGTRIKAAKARDGGGVEPLGEAPTPVADFAAFVGVLASFLIARAPRGVAISIAGVVDPVTGRLRVANIPCLDGRPVADELSAALGLPVWIYNDADCFALAEAHQGAGRGHRNVFGVILGTGVGGGLVIDGRLVTGAGGYAGEWGHGPVVNAGLVPWFDCGCGLRGCLDTVGGARGIERLHAHVTGEQAGSVAVVAGWRAGDAGCVRTVALWADLLSGPLAMVLNVVGASVVPVGGGLGSVPDLIAVLDAAVRARVLRSTREPILRVAELRVEPGLVGAAVAGFAEIARG